MDDSRDELLSQLAEDVEESLSGLQWLKKGAKDERDVKKVMRSRKTLDKAIDAYAKFSDEIEGLDFDDEHNNKWFDKWRSLKADISEIQARMEATVSVVAHSGEDDAFASDDENDKPNAEGIAASLQMADDIKATMDKDIERLADILRISEELKDLADHCLEELQHQRERLMAINAKLKAIDKKVERAEGILERIKVNMAANKCCWAIGCSVIWLLVIIVVVGALCGSTFHHAFVSVSLRLHCARCRLLAFRRSAVRVLFLCTCVLLSFSWKLRRPRCSAWSDYLGSVARRSLLARVIITFFGVYEKALK